MSSAPGFRFAACVAEWAAVKRAPANVQLRRAHLILILAGLVPTCLMLAAGMVLLVVGTSAVGVVTGILIVAFTTTAVTGYILGTVFLSRGASVARFQNDYLSAVSHELNTPLTSIRLFIETLRNDGALDPSEKAKCLELLDREIRRLDGLVARLFDLSRMETGRHEFDRKPVSVDDLFKDTLSAFDAATLSEPVEVEVDNPGGLWVLGDHTALVQALTNLLTNAWKYTAEGDKRIELSARADGKWVDMSVRDNGPGISRSEQREIWQQFERGRAAMSKPEQGSGLGLAIVRAIARGHRGKIDVRSRPGEGAEFTIKLRALPS